MKGLAILLILSLVFANDNILLQKPNPKVFEEVFTPLVNNAKPGDFALELFSQLQEKVKQGGDLHDIQDHIALLKNHLQTDQSADDTFYNQEQARLNHEIDTLVQEVTILRNEQGFLEEKLQVLNSQSNIIDSLFSTDSEAFAQRVGTQRAMIEVIDTLVEQIQANLIQAASLIQKSDLFEELKKLGRGKHIEVLAELTAHLDQGLVSRILDLFGQLRTSLVESIAADEAKEQENIRLHTSLREEIGRLIPQTDTSLAQVLDEIDDRETQMAQLRERLQVLAVAYSERQQSRNLAMNTSADAQDLLSSNMDKLTKWEQMVGSSTQADN